LLSRVGRAIAAVARAPRTAQAMMILLLVGTILGYGAKRVSQEIPSSGTIRVLLVQQNADAWNTQDIARPLLVAQHLTEDGLEASDMPPDFIAWSETSLRYLYDQGRTWYQQNPAEQPFAEFLASLPSPLLTGAPLRNPVTEYAIHNAVLLLLQDGSIDQWYGKRHLVPFVENIPFWDSPLVRSLFQNVVGIPGIWAPGSGDPLLELTLRSGETARIATPICFEDGFPDLVRYLALEGAEILLNLTNNSWSRTDSAQLQHFVAARFRAVETRLGLVRSTNSGYTAVVDPWGSVAASLPMFEAGYLISDVPLYDAPMTMYTRFGDFLPQFLVLVLAVLFAISEIGRLSATKSPRLGLARGRR
jgi:apolipoprotein N-acyltransferase